MRQLQYTIHTHIYICQLHALHIRDTLGVKDNRSERQGEKIKSPTVQTLIDILSLVTS